MTKADIEKHRQHSKQPNSLMWKDFWSEGARKTTVRALSKRLPQTNPAMERLAEIIEKDAQQDADPIIPGMLEVEEPISAAPTNGSAQSTEPPQTAPPKHGAVTIYIGKMLTFLGGQVKDKFKAAELKALGLRIGEDEKKEWTIPASLT